jgi:Flp pilus assembly protein TadD
MPQWLWLGVAWLCAWPLAQPGQAPSTETAQQASSALRSGDFELATRLYRQLSDQYPSDARWALSLATALHSAGQYREALVVLQRIPVNEQRNANYWFLLGMTELKTGSAEPAIASLRRAVQLKPADDMMRFEYALALLEARRTEQAEKEYGALVVSNNASGKAWKGLTLARIRSSDEALAALKKTAPGSSFLYALSATAAAESGDTARAVALYHKALEMSPEAPWMRTELAAVQARHAEACSDSSYACMFWSGRSQQLLGRLAPLRTAEALYWKTRIYNQLAKEALEKLNSLPACAEQHEVVTLLYRNSGKTARPSKNCVKPVNSSRTAANSRANWQKRCG